MRLKFASRHDAGRCFIRLVAGIGGVPVYTIEQAGVRLAQAHNPRNRNCAEESTPRARWAGWKLARDTFRG